MTQATKSFVTAGALIAAAILGQSCAQQQQAPQARQPEFRQSVATAPADLQLACASHVAEDQGIAPGRALPISSATQPDQTYSVLVSAGGRETICNIDADGNVISLQDRAPAEAA